MSNYDAWKNSGNPLDDPEDPFDWIDPEEFYEDLDDDEKAEVDAVFKAHGEKARMEKLRELWHEKNDYDPSEWQDPPEEEIDDRFPYHYPDPNYKDPPSTYGE